MSDTVKIEPLDQDEINQAIQDLAQGDMSMDTTIPESIQTAIAKVMADAKAMKHDSTNKFAGYTYASADTVFEQIRPIMAKHGLAVETQIEGMRNFAHRGIDFAILDVGVRFVGEPQFCVHPVPLNTGSQKGVRMDAQLLQAAITYAIKYFLRGRLLLSTGDIDADTGEIQVAKDGAVKGTQRAPAKKASHAHVAGGEIFVDGYQLKDMRNPTKAQQRTLYVFLDKEGTQEVFDAQRKDIERIIPEAGFAKLVEKFGGEG